jgi:alkylation response protein AidB-like acyl-CoA dehydrogenase
MIISNDNNSIRDLARRFGESVIAPVSQELDHAQEQRPFPGYLYRKMGKEGFLGLNVSTRYGGQGKSPLELFAVIEELSYYDASFGLMCSVASLVTSPIERFGSEEQRQNFLPGIVSGEIIPCFAMTEPEAGSDASNLKTTAIKDGEMFIVDGKKIFITMGGIAECALLVCKMKGESGFSILIVNTKQPGWQARTHDNQLGMRAATSGTISISDLHVPIQNLLGQTGQGLKYALATIDSARIGVAAQALGISKRALDESISYSKQRSVFGAPIANLQAIQWMLADMSVKLEASRLLTYKAAQMLSNGIECSFEAAQAKLFASEVAHFCVDRAMQIHGGYGYVGEFSVIEKLYRDQRLLEIGDGTSEIQRLIIAKNILNKKTSD